MTEKADEEPDSSRQKVSELVINCESCGFLIPENSGGYCPECREIILRVYNECSGNPTARNFFLRTHPNYALLLEQA